MSDKNELLDAVEMVIAPQKKLDIDYFFYVLFSIILVGVLLFPKIYINQQIYHKSRDIAKLKAEYDTLKEENKVIDASVESIKFKNQILDTMF